MTKFKIVWAMLKSWLCYNLNLKKIESSKTIAIDFDGVLAHYKPGMAAKDEQGEPIVGAIIALNYLRFWGFQIVIWTSRPITRKLKNWLKHHNCPYDILLQKPDCCLIIDDRAIQFNGDWPKILVDINNFREWWREK